MSDMETHLVLNRLDGKSFKITAKQFDDGFTYIIYNDKNEQVRTTNERFPTAESAVGSGLRIAEDL